MIKYECSDGRKVSQATIDRNYSKSLNEKHAGCTMFICGGCGKLAHHNDHTISKARCKQIHKTELIWNPENYVNSCHQCHSKWEGYKSGKYLEANNVIERLRFLKEHDPEGYKLRIND